MHTVLRCPRLLGGRNVAISVSVSVCPFISLSVCLSVCISQKLYVQISPNFVYMLPVAVVRSFSDANK